MVLSLDPETTGDPNTSPKFSTPSLRLSDHSNGSFSRSRNYRGPKHLAQVLHTFSALVRSLQWFFLSIQKLQGTQTPRPSSPHLLCACPITPMVLSLDPETTGDPNTSPKFSTPSLRLS